MNVLRRKWQGLPRGVVVCITALVIYVPLLFIVVQSFLSAPFFSRSKSWSLEAFAFIFTDPDFYLALRSGFILAFGLVIIAIPLGGILAFLMVRTDLPGRRIIEPLILVPIFVSPMVLGFGYVVAAGPVGFFSQWAQQLIGFVPWNIYSMFSIVVIAGLTHVPHAYLYISSALRSVGSDVEEAARTVGATPLQVMTSVSLPMVRPSILYACVLLFFLGLEVFGLMLVLGDPEGNLVLATYLYKLTNKLGIPSYHLMAAVAVVLICMTIPLVMLQRRLMRTANRFVTVKGKASRARPLPLGKWRWVAGGVVTFWLLVTIVVPLLGVLLRWREEQLRLYALLGVLLGALIYLLGPGSVVAWLGRRMHGKKHGENAPVQQENAHAKANHSIYNAEKQAYAPEKPPSPVAPASPKLPE